MGNNRTVDRREESSLSEDPGRMCSHSRRRYVLRYCRNTSDTTISVEELAGAVRRHESRADAATAFKDHRLIAIDLHHGHLPKLAQEANLEYDSVEALVYCGSDNTEA